MRNLKRLRRLCERTAVDRQSVQTGRLLAQSRLRAEAKRVENALIDMMTRADLLLSPAVRPSENVDLPIMVGIALEVMENALSDAANISRREARSMIRDLKESTELHEVTTIPRLSQDQEALLQRIVQATRSRGGLSTDELRDRKLLLMMDKLRRKGLVTDEPAPRRGMAAKIIATPEGLDVASEIALRDMF